MAGARARFRPLAAGSGGTALLRGVSVGSRVWQRRPAGTLPRSGSSRPWVPRVLLEAEVFAAQLGWPAGGGMDG